jgi:hypothetical protein
MIITQQMPSYFPLIIIGILKKWDREMKELGYVPILKQRAEH